ncbi:hypothetical protein SERLA73DRAFT_188672 [Serpula lacrymans var. lacrymans S7.3]|uniref:Uncharacterized protein n=2 Tax=Serpula lacrymans var. lacrymans TaxID=341189 RepID=F8QBX2_SERL3|nr:uncharacterized protein SERLADRAFT_479015 [Serpula lacrymans var. lacrymans S7.9]EGN94091.1 hypothetical protein SERLA73DRAFT_188672 [Serpula lacrymans var. lacrymans S7.3]EGO19504.1 hypothetical protein SERLADRAFT_479015 [Serpula lacrymans var. lacrymans S7.9]
MVMRYAVDTGFEFEGPGPSSEEEGEERRESVLIAAYFGPEDGSEDLYCDSEGSDLEGWCSDRQGSSNGPYVDSKDEEEEEEEVRDEGHGDRSLLADAHVQDHINALLQRDMDVSLKPFSGFNLTICYDRGEHMQMLRLYTNYDKPEHRGMRLSDSVREACEGVATGRRMRVRGVGSGRMRIVSGCRDSA